MDARQRSIVKVFQQTSEWSGEHFQGDIIKIDGKLPEVTSFNAVPKDKLWPNATVYYCINESDYSMDQIDSIEESLKMVQTMTKCIHIYRAAKGSKENYVEIKKPPANTGLATHVGMIGGPQPLFLDHKCLFNHGTVIHAFMHVLGLFHEHIREDRDQYIHINWENIDEDKWINFSKVDNTLINDYDTDSILHWGTHAFANDSSVKSITAKTHLQIGQRERLSDMDVEKIQLLYGNITAKETKYFKTFNTRDMFLPAKWVHKVPSPTVPKDPPGKQ